MHKPNSTIKYLLKSFIVILCISINFTSFAQEKVNWDDRSTAVWPTQTRLIDIPSTKDQSLQQAYIYKSTSTSPKPLIISLHTWGGNYAQRDPLLKYCIEADINYIHPDFRGPNNNPKAGGSSYVVQDIDDAIQWAIDSLSVDLSEIHVVGVSGGGFATVLTYMKSKHNINSFHAFVGIYNLEDWYYESLGRKNNYAKDILTITGEIDGKPNPKEVSLRSPLFMKTPVEKRKNSKLHLYAGIHDGYTGSVPISHTLEMYNKVLKDFDAKEKKTEIPAQDMYQLLKRRPLTNFEIIDKGFLGRDILYQKNFKDQLEIIIFEGAHEMPDENLLKRIFKVE